MFGDEVLENHEQTPVSIKSVRLIEPRGLTLRQAYLLPIANTTLIGTTSTPERRATWAEAIPVEGAVLKGREIRNLALLLDRQQQASFKDIEVTYRAGGDSYSTRLAYSLDVRSSTPC